ncbi:MAG: hypothetical protein UR66_C0006G0038 [Candidatus Moranbacteria bacterium GW2011_GWE1_35_17]|nr:MAG: hypothetical protein UR66_C0006G0038 [Candidatus Moranbacteria bacterium GW2011_GWE1_35_17]KKP73176.1 MAG: hypothetical protein UR65_C0006G0020 [Candidatus Moranbacteria bacterium GW2011_GWE2_35_164]KKP82749.1 MAG: hypothetical protein UR82_C0033G0007 [Candidatus Moranbacteria bacterium GW2011_GWF1_35_5]KKP84909.1 MAG: hypothetical protein UR83_C0008G0023 [Candidatus Moranbacteria bacterium GW2011_GWF2_35_54]
MKRLLFFAGVAGIFLAFYLYAVFAIALMLIVFGAVAIFSPLIISAHFLNSPILHIEEVEYDIIHILDKSKKLLRGEGWLTFDEIFSLAEALDMDKDLMRNGYYIALSNLINRKMVETGSKNGEHVYRLIVECNSVGELPCVA